MKRGSSDVCALSWFITQSQNRRKMSVWLLRDTAGYRHSETFYHFFSYLNKWFLLVNRKVTTSTPPEGRLGRGRYIRRPSCWWKENKPLVGKEGEERGISWSERGKPLLRIGGEREGKLLRRGLVRYLKGINWLWGMGGKRVLEFRVMPWLNLRQVWLVRSCSQGLSLLPSSSIIRVILPSLSSERREEISCFGI